MSRLITEFCLDVFLLESPGYLETFLIVTKILKEVRVGQNLGQILRIFGHTKNIKSCNGKPSYES